MKFRDAFGKRGNGLKDVLDQLLCASGVASEALDADALEEIQAAIDAAISVVETRFCRTDRAGYQEWARQLSEDIGETYEPCEAWFDGDLPDSEYAWLGEKLSPDEDADPPEGAT